VLRRQRRADSKLHIFAVGEREKSLQVMGAIGARFFEENIGEFLGN
jgi:hypothetical protein